MYMLFNTSCFLNKEIHYIPSIYISQLFSKQHSPQNRAGDFEAMVLHEDLIQ